MTDPRADLAETIRAMPQERLLRLLGLRVWSAPRSFMDAIDIFDGQCGWFWEWQNRRLAPARNMVGPYASRREAAEAALGFVAAVARSMPDS